MPLTGDGYLAGEYPGGTTTVEGVPVSATVRILYRPESGQAGDGALVAQVQSAPDGTWIITNLNENLRYDVVGRKDGFNDAIVANVTPTSMVDITYAGAVVANETFTGAEGYVEIIGGMPPYSVAVETPFPVGLFPIVDGHKLIVDGTTDADEVASFDVKVTSSNGAEKIIPLQLVVGFKAPANFKAETVVVDDVFSVSLTWEVTNNTQHVKVYRSATPFDLDDLPEPIATLSGTPTTYTDDDVIEDDYFYYMVTAVCEQYELRSDVIAEEVRDGDPHWDNVVALLHFDGNLTDEAGGTWLGSSVSYAPSPDVEFGSEFVGGGGSKVRKATRSIGALWSNVNSFTIEARVTQTSIAGNTTYPGIISKRGNSISYDDFSLLVSGQYGNRLAFSMTTSTGRHSYTSDSVLELGVPTHVAVCYDSLEIRMYVAGVLALREPASGVALNRSNLPLVVGMLASTSLANNSWAGRIDELRITEGVARYTENFTPPTEPFPNK